MEVSSATPDGSSKPVKASKVPSLLSASRPVLPALLWRKGVVFPAVDGTRYVLTGADWLAVEAFNSIIENVDEVELTANCSTVRLPAVKAVTTLHAGIATLTVVAPLLERTMLPE